MNINDIKNDACFRRATLPLKFHYAFKNAAFAAYLLFVTVILRQRGIDSTVTGTIYLGSTLFSLVATPVLGSFADRYRNIQFLLCIWLGIGLLTFTVINFTPRVTELETVNRSASKITSYNESGSITSTPVVHYYHYVTQWPFWIYVVSVVINNLSFAIVNSYSDTICFFVLNKFKVPEAFGLQRLWGAVGWGICSVIGGSLVDFFNLPSYLFYTPTLIISAVLFIADAIVVYCFIDISFLHEITNKSSSQTHIAKQVVFVVLSRTEVLLLLADVAIAGTFTSIIKLYQFWLLEDLGADTTMLGLAITIRNFVGELPFFLVSGYVITWLGHGTTMKMAILLLVIAELLYSVFKVVYLCYIAEILVGLAIAAFFTTMPSYAASVAPPGTETTVQALVGTFFEGIGGACGSLYGGIGFDYLGGRWMVRGISFIGIGVCLSTSLLGCLCAAKTKENVTFAVLTNKDAGTESRGKLQVFK